MTTIYYPLAVLQENYFRSKFPDSNRTFTHGDSKTVCLGLPQWERKLIQLLLDGKFSDAIIFINTDSAVGSLGLYQRTKLLIRTHLLNSHYKAILDFDSRLNALPVTTDSAELSAFIECKLLLILSWYLRGEFHQCLQKFVQLLQEIPDLVDLMDSLPKDDIFVSNETVFYIITVSALISIPLDNLDTFLHLSELEQFNRRFMVLAGKAQLLIDCKFGKFFQWWQNDMDNVCKRDYFLQKKWSLVSKTMRQKIYAFYLRISTKFQISYLSERFGIPHLLVSTELTELIAEASLCFQIRGDLVMYKEFSAQNSLRDMMFAEDAAIDRKLDQLKRQNTNMRSLIDEQLASRKKTIREASDSITEIPLNHEDVFYSSDAELSYDVADHYND